MNILLVAATHAEVAPLIHTLQTDDLPDAYDSYGIRGGALDVCITGAGLMQATFAITHALHLRSYDLALQAGIAGAFDRSLNLVEVVVVKSEQLGDFGAEDNGQFLDAFALNLAKKSEAPFSRGQLLNPLQDLPFDVSGVPQVKGLTVHTVSGHQPTIDARMARHKGIQTESMEGAALHYVCSRMGVPFIQVRAISNYVEPRNREAWKIKEAIVALNATLKKWLLR